MRRLRGKLILVVFISVILVFAATQLIVSLSLMKYVSSRADSMTRIISKNDGSMPSFDEYEQVDKEDWLAFFSTVYEYDEESAYRTRYFLVYLDENMEAETVNMDHIAAIEEDEAVKMASRAVASDAETGYLGVYRYRVTTDNMGRNVVIFIDCTESLSVQQVVLGLVFTIVTVLALLITLIFAIASKHVIRPFEENARSQKQFITDASHELKTPLAIISANADVLQYKDGESEWLKNISDQVQHMSGLINSLLVLSKMEEIEEQIVEPVDLGKLVKDTADDFSEVFGKKQVEVVMQVHEVTLNANYEQMERLVSVLIENASKYVTESGKVEINLKNSVRYVTFSVSNTATLDEHVELDKLFDRFYRPDSSRSSATGGHGIGLSIAKKIAVQHGGSISAKKVQDGVCFTVLLSNRLKYKEKKKTK